MLVHDPEIHLGGLCGPFLTVKSGGDFSPPLDGERAPRGQAHGIACDQAADGSGLIEGIHDFHHIGGEIHAEGGHRVALLANIGGHECIGEELEEFGGGCLFEFHFVLHGVCFLFLHDLSVYVNLYGIKKTMS
jgi:hypothetical protein